MSGGVCAYHLETSSVVWIAPLPFSRDEVTGIPILDFAGLGSTLQNVEAQFGDPVATLIEKVSSIPTDGGKSAFTFGSGYGMLTLFFLMRGGVLYTVLPQVWQTVLANSLPDCPHREGKVSRKVRGKAKADRRKVIKAASVELAVSTWGFPLMASTRSRKPHDGMADAGCIAIFLKTRLEAVIGNSETPVDLTNRSGVVDCLGSILSTAGSADSRSRPKRKPRRVKGST